MTSYISDEGMIRGYPGVLCGCDSRVGGAILTARRGDWEPRPAANAWRRCSVGRCERCGADALNVHGICRNCGWQAPVDETPSLGETRPAETAMPPAQAAMYPRNTGYGGASGGATAATPGSRAPRSGPATSGPPRYCGVCGARITGSEVFCGQCGSPISSGPGRPGSQPGPGRYQVGPTAWSEEDADAYTEALPEPPSVAAARNPYMNDPYARSYAPSYGSGAGSSQATGGLSRSARITIGALFLGASVLIAIITITLAVIWFSAS